MAYAAKREAWSLGYRHAWNVFADSHPVTTKRGVVAHITADSWFLKINIVRIFNELAPILQPPDN